MRDDQRAPIQSKFSLPNGLLLVVAGVALVSMLLSLVGVDSLPALQITPSPSLLLAALGVPIAFAAYLVWNSTRKRQAASREDANGGPGMPPPNRLASSNHRTIIADRPKTRFADVAGVDEAKDDLQEVVEFLRSPGKFLLLGARIPRGVLLVGPPGTGKTLLARAVAGEAGVPFISASGSEFVELYVGVGASRVRSLFQEARKLAPCIIFVDEIDAVGRKRGSNMGVAHEEREQTLNQMLVEMDGFDPRANVIVVAATNRADVLDDALLRPGRFDRQVHLDLPDATGRESILQVHARGKPLEPTADLHALAKLTTGLSGADLENLVNEAAILAARRDLARIGPDELEEALDRIIAGPRRKSRVLTMREREITAHHEIGHALVAYAHPHADRPHKVTIVSRGMTGGHTRLLPDEDRNMWSKSEFEAAIATALGGHVVEDMLYGEVTTGPSSDLQRATEIARRMVTEFGMSKQIGPLVFQANSMWGDSHDYTSFGDKAAGRIGNEVRQVVELAHKRACEIAQSNREVLLAAAGELKERETLNADDLERLFRTVKQLEVSSGIPEDGPHRAEPRRGLSAAWRRRPARVADGAAAMLAMQRYHR